MNFLIKSLNESNSTGITHRALGLIFNFFTLGVFYKLSLKFIFYTRMFYYFKEYQNRMTSTNSILTWIYVSLKFLEVMILNGNHTLTIKLLYALPNLPIFFIMVSEFKPGTPVTKIWWKNKNCLRIIKIFLENSTIFISHLLIDRTCHNRYYFSLSSHWFNDIW